MIKNYLKISLRNLWKHRGYSSINIIGLAIGLASSIIMLLYVSHELSYDEHHTNADRIYRVVTDLDFSGNQLDLATAPAPMGPTLQQDFPEVEKVVRIRTIGSRIVKKGDMHIKENGIVFSDSTIFDVFTLPMLYGNPKTALARPNTVVITESIAKKYFGMADAVGSSITILEEFDFEVTGVIEDMPSTSHFHFNFLISMGSTDEADNNTWFSNNFRTYILLEPGVDPENFEKRFETVKKQYIEPQLKSFMGINLDEFESSGNRVEYSLQPLTSIHLHSDLTAEFEPNGSIVYVYIFSGLALFVLALACINFMNLATARSAKRAKEVGIRKTLGSARSQLTVQFLSESILLTIIAFMVSLLLIEISLPFFNRLAGITLTANYIANPQILTMVVIVVLITGLLSGSYPALLLSSFNPVKVLKGSFSQDSGHSKLRKYLVVFQFSISIVIIVGLLVVNKQLNFIQQKELGFSKEQIIVVQDAYTLGSSYAVESLKEEMLNDPMITSATISSYFPVHGFGYNEIAHWPTGEEPTQNNMVSLQTWGVDEDYIPTLGMELIAGRNFDKERSTDERTVILNDAAVKKFRFDKPVGQFISTFVEAEDGTLKDDEYQEYRVIGVVRNFHFESMKQSIAPLGLFYNPSHGNVAFKVSASHIQPVIVKLENWWSKRAPDKPFNYTFLDQQFDQMYRSEQNMEDIITGFSILAVVIACLGLIGLSAYSAERRTREIGIRKVMGATVSDILGLMSGEFMKLIGISLLIAIPVSFWLMSIWLQDFAYRTNISLDLFLIAGFGAILVAVLSVSWQSLKAAFQNPVDSLRMD